MKTNIETPKWVLLVNDHPLDGIWATSTEALTIMQTLTKQLIKQYGSQATQFTFTLKQVTNDWLLHNQVAQTTWNQVHTWLDNLDLSDVQT